MAKVWNKPTLECISFYMKTKAIQTFKKSEFEYKGTFLLGSYFFLQFARLSPDLCGSIQFENINIDDISRFVMFLQKSSEATSPAATQESP